MTRVIIGPVKAPVRSSKMRHKEPRPSSEFPAFATMRVGASFPVTLEDPTEKETLRVTRKLYNLCHYYKARTNKVFSVRTVGNVLTIWRIK